MIIVIMMLIIVTLIYEHILVTLKTWWCLHNRLIIDDWKDGRLSLILDTTLSIEGRLLGL